jgi:S-adenosylmethionine decarboxylase
LEDGARAAGATLSHSHYHQFGDGEGVSGVTVLAESHITIHTWPEVGYAAIDVFMCGDADPKVCLALLKERFKPREVLAQNHRRGTLATEARAQRVA